MVLPSHLLKGPFHVNCLGIASTYLPANLNIWVIHFKIPWRRKCLVLRKYRSPEFTISILNKDLQELRLSFLIWGLTYIQH